LGAPEIAANYQLRNGRYYWKVVAADSLGNTGSAGPQSFRIGVGLPGVPVLISPADLAVTTDNTPKFEWSGTAGAGGTYTLQYATNAGFTTGLVTVPGVTDTAYTVGGALADVRYYWHVQAKNSGGDSSGYQATPFSFTVDTQAPDVPTLLFPKDLAVITDNTPDLRWILTAGSGGTYTVEYATDPLFATAVTIAGLPVTPYTVGAPLTDGDYYWHVKARDAAGNESAYQAAPYKFTVAAGALNVPLLLSPPNLSFTTDSTPTFVWSSSLPVTTAGDRTSATAQGSALPGTYTLQYSTDPSFTTATSVADIAETTYTVPGASALGRTTWYWRVESIDLGGNHSGYQAQAFRVGIFLAGDVNLSGNVSSSDIIYLVNYVFKGGLAPLACAAAGDVNCDGAVTSSDIIYLVNFVFKGGTRPCDLGALIEAGTWHCP
jgi:hypothetical protein